MEFSIDIHTKLCGEILIEDFSKEYGQYLDEDSEVVTSFDYYKYSESATINSIMKININSVELKDVLLNDHTGDIDSSLFKVKQDGYYVVDHLVIPNMTWYENATTEYKEYYGTIYVTDGDRVYKEIDGSLVECTIKEILERNIEGTTIKKCKIDVFFTGNLQECYINYCKKLFDGMLNTCDVSSTNELVFARDFIWMTLNIIDYLVGFKQYMEAQRLIELFLKCGGFCEQKGPYKPKLSHCGCS